MTCDPGNLGTLVPGYLVTWLPCDPGYLDAWVPRYLVTLVPWYLGVWLPGCLDGWVTLVPGDPNDGALGRYGDGDLMTQ